MGIKERVREFALNQSINRMADLAAKGDPDKNLRRIIKLGEKITSDPIGIDDNDEFAESSWACYGGSWTYYDDETDYGNLMIRAVIDPPAFSEIGTNSYLRVRSLLE